MISKRDIEKINYNKINYFLFEKIGEDFFLTNEWGDFIFLNEKDFKLFLSGNIKEKSALYEQLVEKGFIKNKKRLNFLIQKYRKKKSYFLNSPSLHIIVVTLRCNLNCVYCQASARDVKKTGYDMDEKTAKKVIDMIFQTPSMKITLEFQGGEPLVNWEIVKFIVNYAEEKNKKYKKNLGFAIVTNLSLMDDEKFNFLVKHKVGITTSLDGDSLLQNKNRVMLNGDSFQPVARWSKKFFKVYPKLEKKGYFSKLSALTTITKFSLLRYKEIIDVYIELGFDAIFLRPIQPFGFSSDSKEKWNKMAYSAEDFLFFYKKALEYILELNKKGIKFREIYALIFLEKIFKEEDPGYLDLRSPCGAGIGQLAYQYNGKVYSCDEGRMMSMMGDESFFLGDVFKNSFQEIVNNPTVKSLCISSCLETIPGCENCVFRPFCGTCPIYNYSVYGNIFPKSIKKNEMCVLHKGLLNLIFEKIKEDKENFQILKSWIKK